MDIHSRNMQTSSPFCRPWCHMQIHYVKLSCDTGRISADYTLLNSEYIRCLYWKYICCLYSENICWLYSEYMMPIELIISWPSDGSILTWKPLYLCLPSNEDIWLLLQMNSVIHVFYLQIQLKVSSNGEMTDNDPVFLKLRVSSSVLNQWNIIRV